MHLGARIAAWRKAKGVSQQALATKVGVSRAAVFLWEGGGDKSKQTSPSIANLEAVAKALGLTMSEFYGPIPKRENKAAS